MHPWHIRNSRWVVEVASSSLNHWYFKYLLNATRFHILTTAKIYQLKYIQQSESAMSNLFNRRVTVMASIFLETKCLNTAWKRISSAIIFHVLLRVYEYTKTKGLDRYDSRSGKTTSLPKSHTWNWWITRITSIIAENKPHVHHESHLHTMKVVTILIPSFHSLC